MIRKCREKDCPNPALTYSNYCGEHQDPDSRQEGGSARARKKGKKAMRKLIKRKK